MLGPVFVAMVTLMNGHAQPGLLSFCSLRYNKQSQSRPLGISPWGDKERNLHMQAGVPAAHDKLQTMFIPVVLRMILGLVWNQFHE